MKLVKDADKNTSNKPEVSDKQAEEAFRTILKWIGEDPNREGLVETPKRVIKAFKEYFRGYHQDAEADLSKTFGDVYKRQTPITGFFFFNCQFKSFLIHITLH